MSSEELLKNATVYRPSSDSPLPRTESPQADSSPNFYANRLKRGIASGAGFLLDAPERAANLAMLPVGYMAQGLFGKTIEPTNYNRFTEMLQRGLDVEQPMQAEGAMQSILGSAVEGAGAALVGGAPLGGMITRGATSGLGALARYMGTQGGLGAMAGAGAETGSQLSGGNPIATIAGGLIGGVAIPAARTPLSSLVRAATNVSDDAVSQAAGRAAQRAEPVVKQLVNNQLRQSVAGTPNAAQNIDDALALTQKIPGFKPSVAEMSGSKGAAQVQAKYAMTSPQRLNEELARTEANKRAIEAYYSRVAPDAPSPSAVRSSVNESLAATGKARTAAEQAVAGQLPRADQMATGQRLTELAGAEKAAARPAITAAYQKAFDTAGTQTVSGQKIVDAVEDVLGQKLSQIKPETAPQSVQALRKILGDDQAKNLSLKDLHDIRVAIGQDMAAASRSSDPTAATRLYNLNKVMPQVDDAIGQMPAPARTAYQAATDKYRTEYAPRFKEGAAGRVFKDTSQNEPRILPDKFVSEFFKPDAQAGVTRATQFKALFGNNEEAKTLAKSGILDTYRQKVVDPTTGVINREAHNKFIMDHGRALQSFDDAGVGAFKELRRIGEQADAARAATQQFEATAKRLRVDTVDELVSTAIKSPRDMANAVMGMSDDARKQFTRLVMDRATASRNSSEIVKFINEHEKTLRIIPGMRQQHMTDLKDIAKAYEIAERAPLRGNVQTGGPDVLKNATDVSTATVWAQMRATTAGRQAPVTGAFNLAMPMLNRLARTRFSDVMEDALHNPETARQLRTFLTSQNPQQVSNSAGWIANIAQTGKAFASIVYSAKGPVLRHILGTESYPMGAARTAPAIVGNMAENEQQ